MPKKREPDFRDRGVSDAKFCDGTFSKKKLSRIRRLPEHRQELNRLKGTRKRYGAKITLPKVKL